MGKSTNNNEDGRLVSALRVHLAMRDRVKFLGKIVAGALGHRRRTSKADKDGSGARREGPFSLRYPAKLG